MVTRKRIQVCIERAIERLPNEYRELLDERGVGIVVLDEPPADVDEDVLATFNGETIFDGDLSSSLPGEPPRIEFYVSAFEGLCEDHKALEEEVRLTVLHEIGHFMGLEEEDLGDV